MIIGSLYTYGQDNMILGSYPSNCIRLLSSRWEQRLDSRTNRLGWSIAGVVLYPGQAVLYIQLSGFWGEWV